MRHLFSALAAAAVLFASLPDPAAAAPAGKITLYTSQPDKIAAETVAAFRKTAPDVEVSVFRSGTTEVMNKLQAEFAAGAPAADLLFIADAVSMEQLKADHRLAPVAGLDLAAFPAGAYDPGLTYFGTKLITTGIVYNTAAKTKPTGWKDLLASDAKGQVIVPSPLYSGAAAIQMAALGSDYYEKLAGNGARAARGNGAVLTAVAGGQKMYGMLVEFMAFDAIRQGSPVGFILPSDGVSAVTEPVAILQGSRNPEAAQAFVRFILSREGQELTSRQGFLPARTDVPPPPGFPAPGSFKLLPIDTAKVLGQDEKMKATFLDLFGG